MPIPGSHRRLSWMPVLARDPQLVAALNEAIGVEGEEIGEHAADRRTMRSLLTRS